MWEMSYTWSAIVILLGSSFGPSYWLITNDLTVVPLLIKGIDTKFEGDEPATPVIGHEPMTVRR
jgi:hypothetical protein